MQDNITVVTAANLNFKGYLTHCVNSITQHGYSTLIYDLSGLGIGKTFADNRVSDEIGGKIPCKPSIILDALDQVNNNSYLAWLDSDTLMTGNIDGIKLNYDLAVTIRKPKAQENGFPINAGVVFIRKTPAAINFVKNWVNLCENAKSDQAQLNLMCLMTSEHREKIVTRYDANVYGFPCELYNNFYMKKADVNNAKIMHYKSKLRGVYPYPI